jgi:hypothetical protein
MTMYLDAIHRPGDCDRTVEIEAMAAVISHMPFLASDRHFADTVSEFGHRLPKASIPCDGINGVSLLQCGPSNWHA